MKEELVLKAYEIAKERYAEKGVDTDKVLEQRFLRLRLPLIR